MYTDIAWSDGCSKNLKQICGGPNEPARMHNQCRFYEHDCLAKDWKPADGEGYENVPQGTVDDLIYNKETTMEDVTGNIANPNQINRKPANEEIIQLEPPKKKKKPEGVRKHLGLIIFLVILGIVAILVIAYVAIKLRTKHKKKREMLEVQNSPLMKAEEQYVVI